MSGFLGATAQPNLTGGDIKTAYEAQPDTNAYDDAEKAQVATNKSGVADHAAAFSIITRSKVYLERATDLIYPDAPTESTAGIAAVLADLGAAGGGQLIFPRQASFTGRIADIPANVAIDFNGSKLTPVGDLETCVTVNGSQGTALSLQTGAQMHDSTIRVTGFVAAGGVVGSWLWILDDSSRLTDGQVDINNNVRQVMAVVPGSPDVVYLDMPLSFKKSAVGSGRRNVTILTMKEGVKLFNLHTQPSDTSGHGTGILARWCKDMEVHGRLHENGASGTANDFRACVDVRGSDFKNRDVRDPANYGLGILQGSREVVIDGVRGEGDRHTVDMDSCDLCKVVNAVSVGALSTPYIMAHNGVGGFGNVIKGEILFGPDNFGGYAFNTRGFNEVTGQGEDETVFPILSPRVKIRGRQQRSNGTSTNTGLYVRQPVVDGDFDIDLVNGDGTADVNNSMCARFYQSDNTGTLRIRRSLGYKRGFFCSTEGITTGEDSGLEIVIDWIDYCGNAVFTQDIDGMNLRKLIAGVNVSDKLLLLQQTGGGRRLRRLSIGEISTNMPAAAENLIEVTGDGASGYTFGEIGSIYTPETAVILTKSADFTLSLSEILSHGKRPIRIEGGAACQITEIAKGLVMGQRVSIFSHTAVTNPVTIGPSATNFLSNEIRTLSYDILTLEWDGAMWRPLA